MDQRVSADVSWLLGFMDDALREALEAAGIDRQHQGTVMSRVRLELEYALIGEPRAEMEEANSVGRVPSLVKVA